MDDKLLVDAIADGGAEPAHLEIKYVMVLLSLFAVLDCDSFCASVGRVVKFSGFCAELRIMLRRAMRGITLRSSRIWTSY